MSIKLSSDTRFLCHCHADLSPMTEFQSNSTGQKQYDTMRRDAGRIWGPRIILCCLRMVCRFQPPSSDRRVITDVIGQDLGVGWINAFPTNRLALAPDCLVGDLPSFLAHRPPTSQLTVGLSASRQAHITILPYPTKRPFSTASITAISW